MRRRVPRPFGQSVSITRLASLIFAMALLWMLYGRMRDPATWRFLAKDEPDPKSIAKVPAEFKETVVPGPNHTNEDELAEAQRNFEFLIDRAPLKSREMDAYWRLMAWSRTEKLADLEKQARRDVPFTQLWDQPERYRGQPIHLRLHVRRVLEYDAPENTHGIKKVYEAWGWTDESRSFPYVVVMPERPEGLPIGTEIHGEIVFVGYFLKIMSYTAFEKARGAPLLVGRARSVATPSLKSNQTDSSTVLILALICGVLLIGSSVWMGLQPRKKPTQRIMPDELPVMGSLSNRAFGDDLFANEDDSFAENRAPLVETRAESPRPSLELPTVPNVSATVTANSEDQPAPPAS